MSREKLKTILNDNGSDHYKKGSIEPAEYIAANDLPFFEGNIVKYITRHKHSGKGVADLIKTKLYIDMILADTYDLFSSEAKQRIKTFNKP